MPEKPYSEEQVQDALAAISDPERYRAAEQAVAEAAPSLQAILFQALEAGGWFGETLSSLLATLISGGWLNRSGRNGSEIGGGIIMTVLSTTARRAWL